MTDTPLNDDFRPLPRFDGVWTRLAFWGCAAAAFLAACVAIFAAPVAGWNGLVLLFGLSAAGFVLLYVLVVGEYAARAMQSSTDVDDGGAAAAAFELTDEPMLVTDHRGTPVQANPAYLALCERHGVRVDGGLIGLDALLSGDPDAAAGYFRLSRKALAGESQSLDLADGWLSERARARRLTAAPLNGRRTLWRLSAAEEERPRGDAPNRENRSTIAESLPVGLVSFTADGAVLYANATLRDWLGVEPDAAGETLEALLGADNARALLRRRKGVARSELTFRQRDGVESPAIALTRWPDDGGAAVAVAYAAPRAGSELAAQALSPSDIFEGAPFGVARLDDSDPRQARLADANPALVAMTKGQAKPGEGFAELFVPGALDALDQIHDEDPVETQILESDRDAHVYFTQDGQGGWLAFVLDVSGWKEMERQLVQSQKMQAIGQLAGGVAHDFNNLLTAIRGNCDLLLERHPVGDPAYPELQQINQTVNRAAGLVKKLLAFSRKQTFRAETLDIPDLLSDLSVLLRQVLEETVKIDIVHGRDVPKVRADKGQIETALMNLSTNARDAMRENGGGTLTITTERATQADMPLSGQSAPAGEYLLISVSDTGCGMDAETAEKIFEPFFTTKDPGKGTGLGLATVYGIVKQSGGFLFVDSQPGEGTAFRIFLPAADESADAQDAGAAQPDADKAPRKPADLAGHGRILLVEDEDAVRQIAAKTLIKRGYEVIEASDGEEALEKLEEGLGQIDLLITDVVMPGLDGPGLLEKGRAHLGEARVIFISGFAEEEFSDVLSREVDVSFLPKPFTLPQLAERVKKALNGD